MLPIPKYAGEVTLDGGLDNREHRQSLGHRLTSQSSTRAGLDAQGCTLARLALGFPLCSKRGALGGEGRRLGRELVLQDEAGVAQLGVGGLVLPLF